MPPVELVAFLCYKKDMEKQTKELDENIFKEVMEIYREECEKARKKQERALARKKKKNANKKS